MSNKDLDFLEHTFLFSGLDSKDAESIKKLKYFDICNFEKGECIFSPSVFSDRIGFVKDGICAVQRMHSDGSSLPLNEIERYGTFGIIAVLTDNDEYPTSVYAKTKCTVCFLHKNDFVKIFSEYPTVAMNTARFLADRISFLNKKIATFSGTTVEKKLAHHLLTLADKFQSTEFVFNRKRGAEAISTGRASLYRALASLKECEFIDYDNKKIFILDREGLERKSQ